MSVSEALNIVEDEPGEGDDHQDHEGDGHEHDGCLADVGGVVLLRLTHHLSFVSLQDLHIDHSVCAHVIQQHLTLSLADKDCQHLPCGIEVGC